MVPVAKWQMPFVLRLLFEAFLHGDVGIFRYHPSCSEFFNIDTSCNRCCETVEYNFGACVALSDSESVGPSKFSHVGFMGYEFIG